MPILDDEHYSRLMVANRFHRIVRTRLDLMGLDDVEVHCEEDSGWYGDSIEIRFKHVTKDLPVLLSIEPFGGSVVAPPVLQAHPVAGKYRPVRELEALISEAVGCVSGFVMDRVLVLH